MSNSRSLLDNELPDDQKLTPAENKLIDEASTGSSQEGFRARMVSNIYSIKITRMLIRSNEELAKANTESAKQLNKYTLWLVIATAILAVATIFLVIATFRLASV